MQPQKNGMVERYNGRVEDVLRIHRLQREPRAYRLEPYHAVQSVVSAISIGLKNALAGDDGLAQQ